MTRNDAMGRYVDNNNNVPKISNSEFFFISFAYFSSFSSHAYLYFVSCSCAHIFPRFLEFNCEGKPWKIRRRWRKYGTYNSAWMSFHFCVASFSIRENYTIKTCKWICGVINAGNSYLLAVLYNLRWWCSCWWNYSGV